MTGTNQHTIKSICFELALARDDNYIHYDKEIRSSFHELTILLNELFDSFKMGNKLVRFNRLEINLGRVYKLNLSLLFSLICAKLKEQLDPVINSNFSLNNESVPGSIPLLDAGKYTHSQISIIKTSHQVYEAFLYFLKVGSLPWWEQKHTLAEIENKIGQKLATKNTKLINNLKDLFTDEAILIRFLIQFSEKFVGEVFIQFRETSKNILNTEIIDSNSYLQPEYRIFLNEIINPFTDLLKSSAVSKSISLLNQKQLLYFVEYQLMFKKRFNKIINVISLYLNEIHSVINESGSKSLSLPKIRTKYVNKVSEYLMQKKSISGSKKSKPDIADDSGISIQNKLDSSDAIDASGSFISDTEHSTDTEIYIANSGLVILHPFLEFFFSNIGLLTQEKEFKGDNEKNRAILLLNYIIYREETNPENELVLNKILCGASFHEPVQNTFKIKKSEIDEVDNLLNSVIGHWLVLKKTSPETLVDSFFKRQGKLTCKNNAYYLDIESKSIDILLEKLTWEISHIRFPWMNDMLYVNW